MDSWLVRKSVLCPPPPPPPQSQSCSAVPGSAVHVKRCLKSFSFIIVLSCWPG